MLPSREDDNWGIASRSFDVMHQAIKSRGKCSTKGIPPWGTDRY